jgi:ribose-phosphate pyrophosphokinase
MTLPAAHEPLIFAPAESRVLALAASRDSGIALADLEEREYEGGEFKLRPLLSVRDRKVFVVQSLVETPESSIALRLVRLLFLLQGLRDAGAAHLTAVLPYLAYARKDRRTKPRDPVYTRYMAELLEVTGIKRVIALDVHNASALDNAFRIPTDHLTALPMMAQHFKRHFASGKWAVASPDIGGIKRAQQFRELLERHLSQEVELVFVEKRRTSGVVSGDAIVGNAAGHNIIVLDDLCASGATLIRAAKSLRAAGATSVHAAVTHTPIQSGLAALVAAEEISEVVITDSVGIPLRPDTTVKGDKVRILSVAPLLGCAMARAARGEPLSPLMEHWPLPREP